VPLTLTLVLCFSFLIAAEEEEDFNDVEPWDREDFFLYDGYMNFTKNHLLTTLDTWQKEFGICFHVKIYEWPTGTKWKAANLIHFTLGQNSGAGHRIPAIWITNNGLMHISSGISGNANKYFDRGGLSVGDWNEVCVFQTKNEDDKYYFGVNVNGEQMVSEENTKPAEYKNIKVYVSDNWSDAAIGKIKNLKIMQNIEGWVSVPGELVEIDEGPHGVWGVNYLDNLYSLKESIWEHVPAVLLKDISVGKNSVWATLPHTDDIFRRKEGKDWEVINGKLKQVSVCANSDNVAWGVNSEENIYFNSNGGPRWTKIDGKLSMVSCGVGGVWAITPKSQIVYMKGTYGNTASSGTGWQNIVGELQWISSGNKGEVWGSTSNGNVYKRAGITESKPEGTHWEHVHSEKMKRVAVWNRRVWGLTDKSKIYYRSTRTT